MRIGAEEARHCLLLLERLRELGASYGDFPAHAGLWEAAFGTRNDLLGRLTVVPMVLEARGLDVNPTMANRLKTAGDQRTADILEVIYQDEIGHVAIGTKWFHEICMRQSLKPDDVFRHKLEKYFKGQLKPPFNRDARDRAGLPRGYYDREMKKINADTFST